MEGLYEQFAFKLREIDFKHKRYLYSKIDWNRRLVIIKGTRRVGKTTLTLQYVKNNCEFNESVLYVSSDNIYFSDNSLEDLAEKFVKRGGKHLFIDEIHKYPNWREELKQVLNKYVDLRIVIIGTAVLDYKDNTFISGQAVEYELAGLSFREYIMFSSDISFPACNLQDVMQKHVLISSDITRIIDPVTVFPAYIKFGHYPFYRKDRSKFFEILQNAVNLILETDLTHAKNVDFKNIFKIKKLLYYIAKNPTIKPNISQMSEKIGATRGTILQYLDYLQKARVINLLKANNIEDSFMVKPERIYLNNTNLYSALVPINNVKCFMQKTYFFNQLKIIADIKYSEESDFIVNNKSEFIVDDNSNIEKEIFQYSNKYFATDNIEIGVKNKIPLWLFGFLY